LSHKWCGAENEKILQGLQSSDPLKAFMRQLDSFWISDAAEVIVKTEWRHLIARGAQ